MQAFLVREPGAYAVEKVSEASPGPGEVAVTVVAVGICGSDLELLDGRRPAAYVRYPVVPGHEWAGRVASLGRGVTGLAPGDPVVAEGLRSCGVCERCAEGRTNLCTAAYAETGFTHPGALAEQVVVPARLVHRLPTNRPLESAALLEPAACVANGLLEAGVPRPGARLAVVGDGPLGLLALLLLRAVSPAELALVSRRPARAARGRDCGATLVVNARDQDAMAELSGRFDTVVDTTTSPEGPASSLTMLRRGGTAVLLGISGADRPTIDPDTIALGACGTRIDKMLSMLRRSLTLRSEAARRREGRGCRNRHPQHRSAGTETQTPRPDRDHRASQPSWRSSIANPSPGAGGRRHLVPDQDHRASSTRGPASVGCLWLLMFAADCRAAPSGPPVPSAVSEPA